MLHRRSQQGLTLIETLLILSVVTSVLAVFVPTFFRHLRTSKVSEGAEQLQLLHHRASAYFGASHAGTAETSPQRQCLPSAAGPWPPEVGSEPQEVDFSAAETAGGNTWRALEFQPASPIRFRYSFLPTQSGCSLEPTDDGQVALTLRAEGDVDGDGQLSSFERDSSISTDLELIPLGPLHANNPVE